MKRARLVWLIVAFVFSLNYAWTRSSDTNGRLVYFFVYFTAYLILISLLFFVVRWAVRWRMFTARQHPGLICEHTITLLDDKLVEETPVNRTEHFWAGVYNVVDAPKHIFIYIAVNAAHVIPKRAFLDTVAAQAFFEKAQTLYATTRPAA